jgi:hypothetical protein
MTLIESNIHIFSVQEVRIQEKLSHHKPIKMTKNCLFLPAINILMTRNVPEKTIITKAGMMILRKKCGCEVPILK